MPGTQPPVIAGGIRQGEKLRVPDRPDSELWEVVGRGEDKSLKLRSPSGETRELNVPELRLCDPDTLPPDLRLSWPPRGAQTHDWRVVGYDREKGRVRLQRDSGSEVEANLRELTTAGENWARLQMAPRVSRSNASTRSLGAFVDEAHKREKLIKSDDDVYAIYASVRDPNPLKAGPGREGVRRARDTFLDEVGEITRGRPEGSWTLSQRRGGDVDAAIDKGRGRRALDGNDVDSAGRPLTREDLLASADRDFFHFGRPGDGHPRERLYVNASADHATSVMRFLVRDVLDKPGQFPGVTSAKIAGPEATSARPENIVVYFENAAARQRVIEALRRYQAQNPGHFRGEVPAMTEPVMPGVAIGAEPNREIALRGVARGRGVEVDQLERRDRGFSFGSLRAKAIYFALQDLKAARRSAGPDFDERAFMRDRVRHWLREVGVDPDRPAYNLERP